MAATVALLAFAAWQVGAGPFVSGVRAVGPVPLAVASALTGVATVAAAWRWHLLAAAFGIPVPLRGAVGAYYRSQFLNSVVPGGVVGDLHRGARHGRSAGDVGGGLRAVVWDRTLGQVVQVLVTVGVLAALAAPLLLLLTPVLLAAIAVAMIAVALLAATRRMPARWAAVPASFATDWRMLRRRPAAIAQLVLASIAVLGCHVAVFLVAAAAVGVRTPAAALVPVVLVVLGAMTVPVGLGGWGVREGAAALAFAATGLGSSAGVAAATAYGVLALVAVLPGALVLVLERRRPLLDPATRNA